MAIRNAFQEEMKMQTEIDTSLSGERIGLNGSYDMGWNKRYLGCQYNSLSGHSFMIGSLTRKIISAKMKTK